MGGKGEKPAQEAVCAGSYTNQEGPCITRKDKKDGIRWNQMLDFLGLGFVLLYIEV